MKRFAITLIGLILSRISTVYLLGLILAFLAPTTKVQAETGLFLCDSGGKIGWVDVSTGAVRDIVNTGVVLTDIAVHPNGSMYAISWSNFYKIDLSTRTVENFGAHGIPSATAMVIDHSGTAYVSGYGNTSLYTIDLESGNGAVHHDTQYHGFGDLAFKDGHLFMTSREGSFSYDYYLVELDLAGLGPAREIMELPMSDLWGMDTLEDGNLYGVAGTSVYLIDPDAPTLTPLSSYSGQGLLQAYGASSVPVPEPSTLSLLTLCVLSLLWRRRR